MKRIFIFKHYSNENWITKRVRSASVAGGRTHNLKIETLAPETRMVNTSFHQGFRRATSAL